MVAGGLSVNGPGKLIFCVGTMNTKTYLRTLEHYKEDMLRLDPSGNLFFQQENAPCHKSNLSMKYINDNFGNRLTQWPANSPDLSPIEDLWGIVQNKLQEKSYNNLDDLKLASTCKNLEPYTKEFVPKISKIL